MKGRRQRLSLMGFAALAYVSFGSYQMAVWAGVNPYLAIAYPIIVDMGVIFLMPFSTDAELPDSKEWPIRRHARRTVNAAFGAIILFNALHTWLDAEAGIVLPPWVRPMIALVAGSVPVLLYIRAAALNTMATSWEAHNAVAKAEAARESEAQAARESAAAEAERREREFADQREQARLQREHERDMERRRLDQEAKAARESRRETREIPAPTPAGNPAAELAATLPGNTKLEKLESLITQWWEAGNELTGSGAARMLGYDSKYGRTAASNVRERGILPPAERQPALV